MDQTFGRLQALDGQPVWVELLRAKDLDGPRVHRRGVFRLFDRVENVPGPVTRIIDADGLPLVTFLGTDMLSVVDGALRAELRPSFRVDVNDRPFPNASRADDEVMMYDAAMRDLVAELEAGFRTALIMRPDPNPEASLRARYQVPPTEDGPLPDFSMRFAVGHNSATVRPFDDGIIRLTCIGSTVRDGRQVIDLFETAQGPHYALKPPDIERLANDIRAFLSDRRQRFASIAKRR